MSTKQTVINWDAVRAFGVQDDERSEIVRFQGAVTPQTIVRQREMQNELVVIRECKSRAIERAREEGLPYWRVYRGTGQDAQLFHL